ncbi:MAG: hypothetical protein EKK41_25645 [Hyphomicrobiales bacterium]|nr:MAG: hypothetical protein EKK41_25645 [Hyphomicrobiales bacterium]
MIPSGYLFKQVTSRPDWLDVPGRPQRVFSMSGCISRDFADYTDAWRHNGFWLFDEPQIIEHFATANGISLAGLTCFYYETFEQQYDAVTATWQPVVLHPDLPTAVTVPTKAALHGFDVVAFSGGTGAECSPLSCNSLAEEVAVNDRCLFDTFEEAKRALESGLFRNAEPGPYRIVAVYVVG